MITFSLAVLQPDRLLLVGECSELGRFGIHLMNFYRSITWLSNSGGGNVSPRGPQACWMSSYLCSPTADYLNQVFSTFWLLGHTWCRESKNIVVDNNCWTWSNKELFLSKSQNYDGNNIYNNKFRISVPIAPFSLLPVLLTLQFTNHHMFMLKAASFI